MSYVTVVFVGGGVNNFSTVISLVELSGIEPVGTRGECEQRTVYEQWLYTMR